MKERIQKLIDRLDGMRDDVLARYLDALNEYSSETGSMPAVQRAGLLHDIDKHLTNLNMEMKRIDMLEMADSFIRERKELSHV
jgi:hypothetical protein